MTGIWLILPIAIPLATAVLSLIFRRRLRLVRGLAVGGAGLLLLAASLLFARVWDHGVIAVQVGNWPAPFGITLVSDLLSALMVVLAALMGFAVAIYSLGDIDPRRESFGYYALYHFLLMGVCGAFLTGDLFNLYVWFEVMLMASFVLLALGGERAQLEGALKYVTLNLLSSAVFLAAVGMVYGAVGSLNMAEVAQLFRSLDQPGLATVIAMLFFVAFGIKAAVFPLFAWLPASYHTPPVAVSAIFAGLLTKVGVYAMVRVFTLIFVGDTGFSHGLILGVAALTMLTGVLGAAAQNDVRRILSFHIVSQIGYMIFGLGLLTPLALAGTVFYLAHHIIVKTNLFLIGGVIRRLKGSEALGRIGGLYTSAPLLAVAFLVPALSLAGIPPLSGFWAKFMLIDAGLRAGTYGLVAVALVVGLLTLYSMTKIWAQAFWKPQLDESADAPPPPERSSWLALGLPIGALAVLTIAIGLVAEPVATLAVRAADQLLDPSAYIATVLGGGGP